MKIKDVLPKDKKVEVIIKYSGSLAMPNMIQFSSRNVDMMERYGSLEYDNVIPRSSRFIFLIR